MTTQVILEANSKTFIDLTHDSIIGSGKRCIRHSICGGIDYAASMSSLEPLPALEMSYGCLEPLSKTLIIATIQRRLNLVPTGRFPVM